MSARDLAGEARAYASEITSGRTPACEDHQAAAARFLDDCREAPGRGLRFDAARAARAITFVELLSHHKGEWSGRRLELAPWQVFVVAQLFGWVWESTGRRRFTEAFVELPRKNGKTQLAGALALYLGIGDTEPGAEVYNAATSSDQARIAWDAEVEMVEAQPALRRHARIYRAAGRESIRLPRSSTIRPLAGDNLKQPGRFDGFNVHAAVVDELHAHANRDLWDALKTGTGSRRQPLLLGITTAGVDPLGFCGQLHDLASKVARGLVRNDALFAFTAAADPADDFTLEATWRKANPNLGVSVYLENMATAAHDAEQDPAQQNEFRRKRLNQWVSAQTRYIDLSAWDASAGPLDAGPALEASLTGRPCHVGLDLASTRDLAAMWACFPPLEPDGSYVLIGRNYLPEARATERAAREDRVDWPGWVREGWITTTPGEVFDHAFVERDLEAWRELFDVVTVRYDPWNAVELVARLEESGFTMVVFRQRFGDLTYPTKRLHDLMRQGRLHHGGHPVLRWAADNLMVVEDAHGNVKPDKAKSRQKIDPAVASIMALDGALRGDPSETPRVSVYAEHDLAAL